MHNLNIGCFDRVYPGWINTDITPHIWIARVPLLAWALRKLGLINPERYETHRLGHFRQVRYMDLKRRFPFPDNSIDNIFSAHVLEHLERWDAEHCLREAYRVLKPAGVIRLSVPDLDKAISRYDRENPEALLELVYNARQKTDKNRHHWMYNARSLGRLMSGAGYRDVTQCEFRRGRCSQVEEIDNRPDESLFMEGSK